MSGQWKPGDLLTDDDGSLFFVVDHVPVCPESHLYNAPCVVDADGNGWRRASLDPSVRRLVVLDPEDREQVERLLAGYYTERGEWVAPRSVDKMQAALHEFANPEPAMCAAALNIAGAHYGCDQEQGHGDTHSNREAEAIWGGVQ